MSKRIRFMDILRTIAVFSVMWGHFISVGTFAPTIPGVIADTSHLPILNQNYHPLWKLESWLISSFHTQTAIIGVLLFFIITGYLIPLMQERYSSREFLINRFFRIFPTLFACIIFNAIFVYFTQGIVFKPISYFASVTLLYNFISVPPIMGVLWTLVVEVVFYILAAALKKFNYKKIIGLYGLILLTIVLFSKFQTGTIGYLIYNIRFISYILIGSTIFVSESMDNIHDKVFSILSSFCFALASFKLYFLLFKEETTYPNIGSQLIPLALFVFLYIVQKRWPKVYSSMPKWLYSLSELVYPIYLLHAVFGLGTMFILARQGLNQYLIIAGGVIISLIISILVHYLFEKPSINLGKKVINKTKYPVPDLNKILN